jgi:tetratricopeptide (TPR) repeat protein
MKRKLFLYAWLLAPVALLAYHYGPGQAGLARDAAADKIALAQQLEQKEDWREAVTAYDEALARLPAADSKTRWQLRLARSKARMYAGELPEAIADMEGQLAEMEKSQAPARSAQEVRAALGMAEYYAGWLMRLEGASTAEWNVQVESARQHFRLLAEENLATDPAAAKVHQENLESAIRLARMDLSELQGMPLPKFCKGCKNVSQKCRCQSESKGKKPAEKPKDARGAGSGERPRGGS